MYTVIYRDFYREHPPVKVKIKAESEEQAIDIVAAWRGVKEVLDCKKEIIWNKEIIKFYWRMYSDIIDESKIDLD